MLETVPHGGRLIAARQAFPDAPHPFLDLSTGINSIAYPLPPLPEAAFARLPEPEALAALEHAAATAYALPPQAAIVAAPGTQSLIHLLPRLFPASRVAILGPTYAEHAAAWRLAGATVQETTDPEALAGVQAAVLCNPNNPCGRTLPRSWLLDLASKVALLVIDEAFADFADPALSLAPALPHSAIIVLRSFGKAYGLAGVRLGFALAAPARAATIRAALGPWPVSGPAIAIGRTALADTAWRQTAATRLAADTAALDRCIADLGLQPRGGTALFRLGEGPNARDIYQRLAAAGILTRQFPEHPNWLRFGVPGQKADWARLAKS